MVILLAIVGCVYLGFVRGVYYWSHYFGTLGIFTQCPLLLSSSLWPRLGLPFGLQSFFCL